MIEELITVSIYILQNSEIIDEIIRFQSEENKKIDSKLFREKFACKESCYYCCIGWDIKATIPEILLIIDNLNSFNPEKRLEIFENLNTYKNLKNIDNVPCPMLEEGRCLIYESRPFICRTFSSYDENLCKNKIPFEFPKVVQEIVHESKENLNKIDDFFKPLFNTKIKLSDISFEKESKLFYLNLADTILIFIL